MRRPYGGSSRLCALISWNRYSYPSRSDINVEARRGFFQVPDIIETVGSPIRNPVTGAEHRARIQMPEGVEFRIAEAASGLTRTTGQIPLPNIENTHAQFAYVNFSNKGIADH